MAKPTAAPAPPVATALLDAADYRRERQTARAAMAVQPRESLAKAEAGYYLDVLQGRVKPMVRAGLSLSRQADRLDIELSGRAGFVAASGQISPLMREILARLAAVLAEYRKTVVTVRVRGDDSAPPAGRARLAELRGLAVTAYLVDAGVPRRRILLTSVAAAANPSAGGRLVLQIEPVVRAPSRAPGR